MKKPKYSYELKNLESSNISKTGMCYKKVFKNRSIKSFLNHHIMMKKLNQRIMNAIKFDSVNGRPKIDNGPSDELDRMCLNRNDNFKIEPSEDFTELLTQHVNKIIKHSKPIISLKKDAFHKLKESQKKYELKPATIQYLHFMRNKSPTFIKYKPNLEAIFPHVPFPHFKPLDLKKQTNVHHSYETKKIRNNQQSHEDNGIEHYDDIYKGHAMSFNKYSSRNNLFIKTPYQDSSISPRLFRNVSSSPDFKKMSSRNKKIVGDKLPRVINYNPNYNAIYNAVSMNSSINNSLSKKKVLIRKVMSSYRPTIDYLTVPYLNNYK